MKKTDFGITEENYEFTGKAFENEVHKYEDIQGVSFINCSFSNIILDGCDLDWANFESCIFDGVILKNCKFNETYIHDCTGKIIMRECKQDGLWRTASRVRVKWI